jgi:hypothetical protein
MNRDHKGKALHHFLSTSPLIFAIRNGATQTRWDRLPKDIQEAYCTVGEALAQDSLYGGKYEVSLSSLSDNQIIYNGLLSYVTGVDHMGNGWCHLLMLRSKRDDFEDEEVAPKLAILAQLPGNLFAIQRQIEGVATFVMDFFKYSHFNHPSSGDVTITPDNTTFVEYQPYCTFTDTTDITTTAEKGKSEITIVRFDWQEVPDVARTFKNYTASNPRWQQTSIAAVNTMIHNL